MDSRSAKTNSNQLRHTTLKSGAPIGDKLNSLLVGPKGPNLLADVAYLEETAHFNRERIPERVVHAKGGAAFGFFETSANSTPSISQYCKASLFGEPGKRTPVAVRFSHVTGESGIADTQRDVHGFSVKFYTSTGNWDLVGNNFPVFFIRDPINFSSFIHSQKRNPKTHLRDPDAFWDFISLLPEALHATTMLFSERGTPDGFRHMHGYGVNTFKLVNAKHEAFYAKFHWICHQGIRNLESEAAKRIAGEDPDYSLRDLFANIEAGNFPKWTLKFQVMSVADADAADFNVFDVTKVWPFGKYPLNEIGTMVLNKNAQNYFAQVEQLAFSPANMVPGIEASPDKMLVGRMFSYPDAQRYRLGANYADLPCNQPRCPVMTPTYCDGVTFTSNMVAGAAHGGELLPNYVPSIKYKHLKLHDEQLVEHHQEFSGQQGRYDLSEDDNYSQVRALVVKVMSEESRKRLVANLVDHLRLVRNKEIVAKVVAHYSAISPSLAKAINQSLQRLVNG